MRRRQRSSRPFVNSEFAKSECKCGHVGDGKCSEHGGILGHGPCEVPTCTCSKFTWARWLNLDEQGEYLASLWVEG